MLGVYTGREWARIVCAVLLIIGGLLGAASALLLGTRSSPRTIRMGVFLVAGTAVLFLSFAGLLVFRTPVPDFLDDQAVWNGHAHRQ